MSDDIKPVEPSATAGFAGASLWRRSLPHARFMLDDGIAGSITAVLTVVYCFSFSVLIFSGPVSPLLSYGIDAALISVIVAGAIVALTSSLPLAIAGPDTATSAVLAVAVASFVERVQASGLATDLHSAVFILLALLTAVTGAVLYALGLARAGVAIRYVPYPLVGGFLAATGILMIMGAFRVITGHSLSLADPSVLASPDNLGRLGAGLGFAAALHLLLRRFQGSATLPAALLLGIALGHLWLWPFHTGLAEARASGYLFTIGEPAALSQHWGLVQVSQFPWRLIPSLAGDLAAILFVTAVSILMNAAGLEVLVRREANLDRELRALGLANLAAAAAGGFVSCLSLSRSTLNYSAGATGRSSGLVVAAMAGGALFLGTSILSYVPRFVLGGLLFYLGGSLLMVWAVESRRRLSLSEYLALLAVMVAILSWGFVAGVVIGVVIGCITFALSVSRVDPIKFHFDGTELRSNLDRAADELALLKRYGEQIQGMCLQSYLFFGSANRLFSQIKATLGEHYCRFLVLDFRLVNGMDSSAIQSFTRIKQIVAECATQLVLVGLTPSLEREFRVGGMITEEVKALANLDHALEWCENAVLATYRQPGEERGELRQWLAREFQDPAVAERLASRCRRIELPAEGYLCRQGDPADAMHFILDGRVSVLLAAGEGGEIRLRSLGPHTTVGEIGLFTRQPRTASIRAETPCVLYALMLETFEALREQDLEAYRALTEFTIKVMADRLSFANRTIAALQR